MTGEALGKRANMQNRKISRASASKDSKATSSSSDLMSQQTTRPSICLGPRNHRPRRISSRTQRSQQVIGPEMSMNMKRMRNLYGTRIMRKVRAMKWLGRTARRGGTLFQGR